MWKDEKLKPYYLLWPIRLLKRGRRLKVLSIDRDTYYTLPPLVSLKRRRETDRPFT